MVAEATQMLGLTGVYFVKQWLESTTHLELPWNAYENQTQCTLPLLDGSVKRFDLAGHFLGERRRPIVVEAKKYTTPGHQGTEYKKYLAIAYSSTAKQLAEIGDPEREFFWVTTHPFSQNNWTDLLSREQIKGALATYPELINGTPVDDSLVERVADRLWLLVLHDKQEHLLLSRAELLAVHEKLSRKR
jgi:hypothetical protein